MLPHKSTIVKSASPGFCAPKKTIDHKKFKNNCTKNTFIAFVCFFDFLTFQTKNKENAISAYKSVQTGPKIQFGGLNGGLLRVAYQVGIASLVAILPPAAAAKTTAKLISNFQVLFTYLVFHCFFVVSIVF